MKITYIHQYFNTPSMSGSTRSFELGRRLVEKGHEVTVITTDRAGGSPRGRWRTTVEAGIEVHWVGIPYSNSMSFSERVVAFFRFAWASSKRAATLKSDVIFATSTPLTIVIPAAVGGFWRRVPVVLEVRDLWPEVPIGLKILRNPFLVAGARLLERFGYSISKRVVALSPGMRDGVVAAGKRPEFVSVIPNLADLERFGGEEEAGEGFRNRFDWLGNRPLVLYAGTLGAVNGVEYLAHAAAEAMVANPEVRFLVVGQGGKESIVREEAARLGVLGRNFFMLPSIPKEDMPSLLAAADVSCSLCVPAPVLEHNSANKFFDALAAGRPIAINYGGWQRDLIEEEEIGLLLPPGDPAKAGQVLADAAQDQVLLKRLGQNARRVAEEKFSADGAAEKLESILLEVVSGAG